VFIFTLTMFVTPSQIYAAWWNPLSWFSKNQQIEDQKQSQNTTSSDAISEPQTANQNVVAPVKTQSSDAKTIEDLKAEVATLKASLDNLYTAHNNLVNDHNALLKYVNTIVVPSKNIGAASDNSNLETKITSLETKITSLDKKLDNVCAQIFSSLGGFGTKCPSSQFIIKDTLESRIKKLEEGY